MNKWIGPFLMLSLMSACPALEGDFREGRSITRSPQGIDEGVQERRSRSRQQRENGGQDSDDDLDVRRYDGSGNNERNPDFGATFAHLVRVTPNDYGDGVSSPGGVGLPSAREISNVVHHQAEDVFVPNAFGTSDFLWQWGQFIDHDLDLTDGGADEAFNISIPRADPHFDPTGSGTRTLSFNRAHFDPETGTSAQNPREQENEITSWIDASMVYGSSDERVRALRENGTPFLKTSPGNLLPFNTDALPNANGFITDATSLFLAGDVRVNEQVNLAVMHTLFVREHNRRAAQIQRANPNASDDDVFESARRIVIAEIQKITYEEYLPALLGVSTLPEYEGYDPRRSPDIMNEFSVAAYRFGHSEIGIEITRLDEEMRAIGEGHIALRDAFFSAPTLLIGENDLSPYLRGMATQLHQRIDRQVVTDLRNFLFGRPGQGGLDLVAFNIQRGRDHGIGRYNDVRAAFGLQRKTSFADVSADPEIQRALAEVYSSVDDIELFVGGLCEDPTPRSQLSELFTTIVAKQFDDIRAADRFWHERSLTQDERERIEDVTLADIIRANTNIGNEIQDDVFIAP